MNTPTSQGTEAPHLEWLERGWSLPEGRRAEVVALLARNREGSTALPIPMEQLRADWGRALLQASEAAGQQPRPLVGITDGPAAYLQSWRHFQAEREIALQLRQRLIQTKDAGSARTRQHQEHALGEIFGPKADPLQVQAARTALTRRLALITGGPGTGKTYTLARILALLLLQAEMNKADNPDHPLPRIRLAAPTGKAADRMKEAVRDSVKSLPPEFREHEKALLHAAESACTLHSLLGYNPGEGTCAFHAANPLSCEILIIDEASMIDVFLWQALLAAMPTGEQTRLIILGDPFQLESVGTGDVLHQLVGAPAMEPARVRLLKSRRFESRPGIQALAEAIVNGDGAGIPSFLEAHRDPRAVDGLAWLGEAPRRDPWAALPPAITEKLAAVATASTPELALQALNRVRLLSAHRDSPLGATGLGELINRRLARQLAPHGEALNEPIIINENDPETGLRNGSVGVLCTGPDGERKAWFPAPRVGAPLVSHPLGKLPAYSLAWALTIHRSQGSEFDDILVVLPREESPLATRELVYTAITRARQTVFLLGPRETLTRAVADSSRRCTLLGWAMAGLDSAR